MRAAGCSGKLVNSGRLGRAAIAPIHRGGVRIAGARIAKGGQRQRKLHTGVYRLVCRRDGFGSHVAHRCQEADHRGPAIIIGDGDGGSVGTVIREGVRAGNRSGKLVNGGRLSRAAIAPIHHGGVRIAGAHVAEGGQRGRQQLTLGQGLVSGRGRLGSHIGNQHWEGGRAGCTIAVSDDDGDGESAAVDIRMRASDRSANRIKAGRLSRAAIPPVHGSGVGIIQAGVGEGSKLAGVGCSLRGAQLNRAHRGRYVDLKSHLQAVITGLNFLRIRGDLRGDGEHALNLQGSIQRAGHHHRANRAPEDILHIPNVGWDVAGVGEHQAAGEGQVRQLDGHGAGQHHARGVGQAIVLQLQDEDRLITRLVDGHLHGPIQRQAGGYRECPQLAVGTGARQAGMVASREEHLAAHAHEILW